MDERLSRKMEESSVGLSLRNGIVNSQSDWSRCNSFSSSSSDSTLYCSNSLQCSSFPTRKRLKSIEPVVKRAKRSRNSSGSSASSNLSCVSDKDVKCSTALIAPKQASSEMDNNISIETLADLPDISPSLDLQRETLLNSRLTRSLDMNDVLPFRHNLRRNIRKKTCSCDCTTTCTTVVVSRQYKEVGKKTVEEKTVISRTKVKTFVESKPAQTPVRKVQLSSKVSFQENVSPKNETNRRRRSEMEKLYDSLHEIKWAKNFSPDNILCQLDVRQAASCSAFGRTTNDKPLHKDETSKNFKLSDQGNKETPKKCRGNVEVCMSHDGCGNSYSTRSKTRSSSHSSNCKIHFKDNLSPPVLEKSIIEDEIITIDPPYFNSYPILSKEVFSPEKQTASLFEENTSENNLDFPNSYNSIHTSYTTTYNSFPPKILNFDLNSQFDNDNQINSHSDCSSSFFDIAEDNVHTIDACFREVGAEVVVSTCYESDYKLPLLKSVDKTNSTNEDEDDDSMILDENPPVLEPLLDCKSKISSKFSDGSSIKSKLQKNLKKPNSDEFRTFFPHLDPSMIPYKDYSPPLSFFKSNTITKNKFDRSCKIKLDESNSILPDLISVGNRLDQNTVFESDPPILEPCISNEVVNSESKDETSLKETRVEKDFATQNAFKNLTNDPQCATSHSFIGVTSEPQSAASCSFENATSEPQSAASCSFENATSELQSSASYSNNCLANHKIQSQICKDSKTHHLPKPLIVSGKRIFKKYLKYNNSKSNKQNKRTKAGNNSIKNSILSSNLTSVSNTLCDKDIKQLEDNSSSVSSLTVPANCSQSQLLEPVENSNSSQLSQFSPYQITETIVNKKCIPSESSVQAVSAVLKSESTTVIQTFHQKLSYSETPEKVTFNHNSSVLFQSRKNEPTKSLAISNKKARKSLLNSSSNHYSDHLADDPGYSKILAEAKKKVRHAVEKTLLPHRIFTCHYQTINVVQGSNYIQIVLKITRGKSIFLTHQTLLELNEAVVKARENKDCNLLILNGFGQTFCLGLDLRPLVGARKNQAVGEIANAVKDLIGTLSEFHKPLVAIVNGAAYGLGLTILNHADVTLATNNASFCMPYSRLGYMPEGGATLTLPQTVGTTMAMDLILRGQVITAEQAREIGLINEVVSVKQLPQDLVSRVKAMAENSISSMETTKAMIKMQIHIQLPMILETETKLLPQMWLSPSCQEAIQSALDSGFFADC